MKRSLFIAALFCSATAFAQVQMPAPSTTQRIIQPFGLGNIQLVYSRPNIKGRTVMKDNSELAPLNKVWRTGANAATKIIFSDKVMIGGKLLDTGTYVLYSVPGKEYWDIIINKGLTNWGTDGYKESEDVVRVKVKGEKLSEPMETFTMQFANVQPESCELQLMWGNNAARLPISTNVKDRIRAQVEKALQSDKVDANTYYSAANYYYEFEKSPAKALPYISKATAANTEAYWMLLLQAKIQKDMGDKVSAKASADKCIAVAATAKNDDYVRAATELSKKL